MNAEQEKNKQNADEHRNWEASLAFWHNESIYFNNVLVRVAGQTEDTDEIDKAEKFKSRFDNFNDRLTEVRNKIIVHEQALNDPMMDNFSELNMKHEQIRWEIDKFSKDFRELKNELYKFVDKDCTY